MEIGRAHAAPVDAQVTLPYHLATDPAFRHVIVVATADHLDFGTARPRAVHFTFLTGSAGNVQVHDSDSAAGSDRLCAYPALGTSVDFRTKGRFLKVTDIMSDATALVLAWEL